MSENQTKKRPVVCKSCGRLIVNPTIKNAIFKACSDHLPSEQFPRAQSQGYYTNPVAVVADSKTGDSLEGFGPGTLTASVAVDANGNKKTLHLDMFGNIGGWEGITAEDVRKELNGNGKDAGVIKLTINSGGGDVFEASAIHNLLADHPATVEAHVVGVAASAMTVIVQAADKRTIAKNAYWMVHGPRGFVYGTKDEHLDYIKLLENAHLAIRDAYVAKTGLPVETVEQHLSKDTWMTPQEALDYGYVDAISSASETKPHVEPKQELKHRIQLESWSPEQLSEANACISRLAACVRPDNHHPTEGVFNMGFEAWAAAQGFDLSAMTDEAKANLKQLYENQEQTEDSGSQDASASAATASAAASAATATQTVSAGVDSASDDALAARLERQSQIVEACGDNRKMAAQALREGWSMDRIRAEIAETRLQDLQNSTHDQDGDDSPGFGGGFAVHSRSHSAANTDDVVEAAMCFAMNMDPEAMLNPFGKMPSHEVARAGLSRDVKPLSEKVLDTAQTYFPGMGLQQLVIYANRKENTDLSLNWRGDASIDASYSGVTVPAILKKLVERAIISNYQMAAAQWSRFAGATSVSNFLEHERIRVYGTGRWERSSDGGDLASGQVEVDPQYKLKVDTVGQYLMITREHLVNNDIGSINNIAQSFATYGNLAPEFAAWDLVKKHVLKTTSGSFGFKYDDLKALWGLFIEQVSSAKGPKKDTVRGLAAAIDMEPAVIICHKLKQLDMTELLNGQAVSVGGANDAQSTQLITNALRGMFTMVASSYVVNKESVAIVPAPNTVPAMEIVFLNGRRVPYINRVQSNPNQVPGYGIQGYLDVGATVTDSNLIVTS